MSYTKSQLRQRLDEEYGQSSAFYRDTTLPTVVLAMYEVGIIFQEPTFCDATSKLGGPLAPHRYQLISSNARALGILSSHPEWGLCTWLPGRYFKVIDTTQIGESHQITLLEIPDDLLPYFKGDLLATLEQNLATQAREEFEQIVARPPLPELNTSAWLGRTRPPLGISDEGNFFRRIV